MATKPAACHFRFQAVPGIFIDFVEEARKDPSFRATTLPGLGLVARQYETDRDRTADGGLPGEQKPWERFREYVRYLNSQNAPSTTYKVLYLTRHGLGFHNSFELQVGREAWNVGLTSLYTFFVLLTMGRVIGHTWTGTETLSGLILN